MAEPGALPAMSGNSPLVGWYRDKLIRTAEGWRFAERIGGLDFFKAKAILAAAEPIKDEVKRALERALSGAA